MSTTNETKFKSKIEECCRGLQQYSRNCIINSGEKNGLIICDYIQAVKTETNLSDNYRRDLITVLSRLSRFRNNKLFKSMKKEDIVAFLNTFEKTDSEDPKHKWIGTYNINLVHLTRFLKWLYYPNEVNRQRPIPNVIKNIGKKKRKEQETYSAADLWSNADDELFLRYCSSKRLRCYHMVSRDTSARPHELCKLKVRDIQFRVNADGTQFVEVPVNGKTGNRFLPLFNSVPYVKDYLDHEHPQSNNQNAPFLCETGKSLGKHLSHVRVSHDYSSQKRLFQKLLNSPNTPVEDIQKIHELLRKPWNPYVRRYTALTEKASNPDIAAVLEQHAGWTEGSLMKKKYIHHFQNKASNSILQACGILPKESTELKLRIKPCPQCNEPNTPDRRFCAKCRMVLTYDGYQEALESLLRI
jgi:integrase